MLGQWVSPLIGKIIRFGTNKIEKKRSPITGIVYRHICFPNGDHSLQAPMVFILFIAVSVFRVAQRATALHSDKAVESLLS